MDFPTPQDAAKFAAGRAAAKAYVRSGMKLGLGSGTTSHWFVRGLAEDVRAGLEVVGVPTSSGTRDLARELGIPLGELDDVGALDITFDGADQVDPQGAMIKGGGGSLLWEKIVAYASRRMVVLLDPSKVVEVLGAFPLPIEVVRFGWRTTHRRILALLERGGYADVRLDLRMVGGSPFVTDGGHHILDAHLGRIADKDFLAARLNLIPGVVENGLFVGVAAAMVVGHPDGETEIRQLKPSSGASAP